MMNTLKSPGAESVLIEVESLTLGYGNNLIQRDLSFQVRRGDIFVIMGGSGCGKSTLLLHLIGLLKPWAGRIRYGDQDLFAATEAGRESLLRRIGVLFQSGALLSSLTLAENVALPLSQFTRLSPRQIASVVAYKLALVGLSGFEGYYPSELSGGMQKRAGLARAIALDPEILFFDEPSAGLDPVTSRRLDALILSLREVLGATIVLVTHELASLFAIGTRAIFLDAEQRTLLAEGSPQELLREGLDPKVRRFLTREGTFDPPGASGSRG